MRLGSISLTISVELTGFCNIPFLNICFLRPLEADQAKIGFRSKLWQLACQPTRPRVAASREIVTYRSTRDQASFNSALATIGSTRPSAVGKLDDVSGRSMERSGHCIGVTI